MAYLTAFLDFLNRHRIFSILFFIFLLCFLSAAGLLWLEAGRNPQINSFSESLWWAWVSVTTVGYGDAVPVSGAGRIWGSLVILVGVALVSTFTATISSILVAQKLKEDRGLKQVNLNNHVVVCGWNANGVQIVDALLSGGNGREIVLINQMNEEAVQDLLFQYRKKPLHFVRGDYTHEDILNRANVRKAAAVLIIPDNTTGLGVKSDEKTILAAFTIKAMQPKVKVYAHILDRENEAYLKKAQVDDYWVSDAYTGVMMAEMIRSPGIPQALQGLMKNGTIQRVAVPEALAGKTFGEALLWFRNRGRLPIAVVKELKPLHLRDVLSEDYSYLDEYIERKFKEAGRSFKKGAQMDIRMNPPDDFVLTAEHFLVVIGGGGENGK